MLSLRQELSAYIFGVLLWIPVGSLFIPLFCLFYFASCIVHFLARFLQPDLIPISKSDAFTAFSPSCTKASYVYTCQIWRVKGLIDLDTFRNHFYQCFLSTQEDRKKYVNLYCLFVEYFGYIFKKRVNQIDLQWHIQEHRLNDGISKESFIGTWMVTHDNIQSGESPAVVTERPTWMIKLLFDKFNKETTIVFKLHHGLCDGYTIVHLVGKLSGQTAPYAFKDPIPPFPKLIKTFIQFPYIVAEMWIEMYNLRKQKKTLVQSSANKEQNENWMISLCTLNLETVKEIRRVTKTNFVSVLMSIQMGALKRHFQEMRPISQVFHVETGTTWKTFIGHSMGWPEHPVPTNGGGMANHLTLTSIPAGFHIKDPLERLLDIDKNFRDSKSKGFPVLTYYIVFNILKYSPASFIRSLVNADFSAIAMETAISTLLGASSKHYLLGHPVKNIWLPVVTPSVFQRLKLMTVPASHSGILDVSVNAESSLVKDQESLDRLTKVHFVEELEDLKIRCQNLVE